MTITCIPTLATLPSLHEKRFAIHAEIDRLKALLDEINEEVGSRYKRHDAPESDEDGCNRDDDDDCDICDEREALDLNLGIQVSLDAGVDISVWKMLGWYYTSNHHRR